MEQIIENNKLIAQFMGGELYTRENGKQVLRFRDTEGEITQVCAPVYLSYHESWNDLMPVVEKIESMGFETYICHDPKHGGNYTNICEGSENKGVLRNADSEGIITGQAETKIAATYSAVTQFIQWHTSKVNT